MQVQVQSAPGTGTLNEGEAVVWTGQEPISGVYEVTRISVAGSRPHAVILTTVTEASPGFAEALVFPVRRLYGVAANSGQRLSETATGLRPAVAGDAVSAICLQDALGGEVKLVAQLPATLPRVQRWTGRTGSGIEETIPHSLAGLPDRVFVLLELLPLGFIAPAALTQGTHTTSDLKITVSAGVGYGIYADRFA